MNDQGRADSFSYLSREFLTWLWFESHRKGSLVHLEGTGQLRVDFARRLSLESGGAARERSAVTADLPTLAGEAHAALRAGKKVASTTLLLDVGERHFEVSVDAETFTFRGVKLPTVLATSDVERLDERLALLDELEAILDGLYVAFARLRSDAERWHAVRQELHGWVLRQGQEA